MEQQQVRKSKYMKKQAQAVPHKTAEAALHGDDDDDDDDDDDNDDDDDDDDDNR